MAFENREGQGALFRNNSDNPKAPSHKGDFMLNGAMYSISAWVKEGKNGKFFSLKVEPKQQREAPKAARPAVDPEFDDGLPFVWAIALPLVPLLMAALSVGQATGIV